MKTKLDASFRKVAEDVFGPIEPASPVAPPAAPLAAPVAAPAMDAAPAAQDGPSPQVKEGLCSMVAEAKFNAHAYRQAASILKDAGFIECACHFNKMSKKWCHAAKKAVSLIECLGETVCFKPVAGVGELPNDPHGLASHFFGIEKGVTSKVIAFRQATEDSDVMVHEFLCECIGKRMKMEAKARDFLRIATLAGDDHMGLEHEAKHMLKG